MATYIDRATAIVSNILGKPATQDQVIKAVESVWYINTMGVVYPDGGREGGTPEERAQFFVENCKKFVARQIEIHGDQVAFEANKAAIDASKEDYVGAFDDDDETDPTTTRSKS